MIKRLVGLVGLGLVFVFRYAFAAYPLITDDTGTQGKGHLQVELNSGFEYDEETWTKEIDTTFSYGLGDNTDMVLTVPYQFLEGADGISDISLELKYRFYEKGGLSFALKPSISFPTGDEDKGLGAGETTYGILFITTKEFKKGIVHFNLGYTRDESTTRENLYHLSIGCEIPANERLRFAGDLSGDSNPDKEDDTPVLVGVMGLIYSPKENLDIAFGIQVGLNDVSPDFSILSGIAIRF